MNTIIKQVLRRQSNGLRCIKYNQTCYLSSGQVATALRPFYFAVHPDLFCQHPHEKEVNENSLKHLNAFLETHQSERANLLQKSTKLTFYIRKIEDHGSNSQNKGNFQRLTFDLCNNNLKSTITKILKSSQLSTDYIDNLKPQQESSRTRKHIQYQSKGKPKEYFYDDIGFAEEYLNAFKKKAASEPNLRSWLLKNMDKAYHSLLKTNPLRDQILRINHDIKNTLKLEDIVWDCSYGLSHKRGCIQSFQNLMNQHPILMRSLNGKTIVFATQAGISLDGHVILNIEDVRQRWLDIITSAYGYGERLRGIPVLERNLSGILKGINIVHRKSHSAMTVQSYEKRLRKLTSILETYLFEEKYNNSQLPKCLKDVELVIESESGPLMLSPKGQIITPSCCPAHLLINFLNQHLDEARELLHKHKIMKMKEENHVKRCKNKYQLAVLNKDETVSSDMMISCCERLFNYYPELPFNLYGYRLIISKYYFVNLDGDLFIPWNWKP